MRATPDQLKTLIRFGLEQLKVRNAHHDFEHLCRHLARARICSNIIPSTGPVSAGGDQGRDFETFRTHVDTSGRGGSIFSGLAADARIAFACSTQAGDTATKVRSDVTTICESGYAVSAVHVFLVEDLPVAKRHHLQAWATETYRVELEIYDGNAIAELLADPEVFWIASRYLDIPAEEFPVRAKDEWYRELAVNVRARPVRCETDGEFYELKQLARHATWDEACRSDLPEWVSRLQAASSSNQRLWRAASYEAIVASLRGLNSLEGFDERIDRYFQQIGEIAAAFELRDVACLLRYCLGAVGRNLLAINATTLGNWRSAIAKRLDDLLGAARTANERCTIFDIQFYEALSPLAHSERPARLDDGFPDLEHLVEALPTAPMFPLSRFIDNVTRMQEYLEVVDSEAYLRLTSALDAALAEREGSQAVAYKSRDRALAFLKANKPLLALRFIHDANVKWFSHETLQGSLLAQLLVSNIYDSLGLSKAAQYFGLAQAFISVNSALPEIKAEASRGLFAAAIAAYHGGEWLRFIQLSEIALRVHGGLAPDPGDIERHSKLVDLAFCAACMIATLEKVEPRVAGNVQTRVQGWGLDWLVDDLLNDARSMAASWAAAETWKSLEEQLYGPPLSDAEPYREIAWRQLGVSWSFRFENRGALPAVAEELVASLQIVLADLSHEDLCLLPSTVSAIVRNGPFEITREPSNEKVVWNIAVPPVVSGDDDSNSALAVAGVVLHEISVLRSEVFMAKLEARFKDGLSTKVFVGRRYAELLSTFVERFSVEGDESLAIGPRKFALRDRPSLAWRSDAGPNYVAADVPKALKRRYEQSIGPIRETVAALKHDATFQSALANLRASGWRDWHVLQAIYAICLNAKARAAGHRRPEDMQAFQKTFHGLDETSSGAMPVALFNEHDLKEALNVNMLATLKGLGHQLHQRTPEFPAIERFLVERYRYWVDDIPHSDPFDISCEAPA